MDSKEELGKSINGQVFEVKTLNPSQFLIDADFREKYTEYEGNGIAKQVKVPKVMKFKTIDECDEEGDVD